MHEAGLVNDLLKHIAEISSNNNAINIRAIHVRLGALCHLSEQHFIEHFRQASRNTLAEGATLNVSRSTDQNEPDAQEIILEEVELEILDQ